MARDQGPRPTCLAFAISDGHAFARGSHAALSADYLHYHAARRFGGGMNTAISPVAIMSALNDDGQPTEADCPYDENRSDTWVAPSGLSPVWRRVATAQQGMASTVLEGSLALKKANILALGITSTFYVPDPTSGRILDDGTQGFARHAVLVVGMNSCAGTLEFLVRNSWGTGWGREGYAWLPATYVDRNAIGVIDLT